MHRVKFEKDASIGLLLWFDEILGDNYTAIIVFVMSVYNLRLPLLCIGNCLVRETPCGRKVLYGIYVIGSLPDMDDEVT